MQGERLTRGFKAFGVEMDEGPPKVVVTGQTMLFTGVVNLALYSGAMDIPNSPFSEYLADTSGDGFAQQHIKQTLSSSGINKFDCQVAFRAIALLRILSESCDCYKGDASLELLPLLAHPVLKNLHTDQKDSERLRIFEENIAKQRVLFDAQIEREEWKPADLTRVKMQKNMFVPSANDGKEANVTPWIICRLVLIGTRFRPTGS
jgi:hypothetical protein